MKKEIQDHIKYLKSLTIEEKNQKFDKFLNGLKDLNLDLNNELKILKTIRGEY